MRPTGRFEPPPLRTVAHDEVPELRASHQEHPKTMRGLAIGAVMSLLSGAAGIVGSHWGGVTKDQLDEASEKQRKKLEQKIDEAVTAVDTKMKTYVDAKVEATFAAYPAVKPKRKPKQQPPEER